MIKKKLLLVFVVGLVLRFALVNLAYHGDLNNNISWAQTAFEKGLAGFYELKQRFNKVLEEAYHLINSNKKAYRTKKFPNATGNTQVPKEVK